MTQSQAAPELIPGKPSWWSRQYIEPFTWDEDAMWQCIKTRNFGAFSWVTKENGPVTALMSYIWMDDPAEPQGGNIWITSTTNRHKFQAWRRNPQISICIWPADTTQQQVTLRGRVEMFRDPETHKRWITNFVNRPQNDHLTDEQKAREYTTFDSPNRWYMKVHIERFRTYDGFKMRQAESEGIDVWGDDFDFPQGH